jgi:hypothetical protein
MGLDASGALTFRVEDHTYWLNGQRVPNVTLILAPLTDYSRIPPAALALAQQEGNHIHRTVELFVKNDLDEDTLPAWLKPRLAAFKKFQDETGFVMEGSEQRVYHPKHGYAGTLDLTGTMLDLNNDGAVIDVKRSFYAGPVIGLQTVAYLEADNDRRRREKLPKIERRYALQLRADSTYRLQEFDDEGDFTTFVGLLNAFKWCAKHENNLIWRANGTQH